MYDSFPYEEDIITRSKHKKTPRHIRDVAFMDNDVIHNGNTNIFDIGNNYAEENYPYYHILQDSKVIRKANKSTKYTRGSQEKITPVGARDYGRIKFNGKTYIKEYAKNIRGQRDLSSKATQYATDSRGRLVKINKDADYYLNTHYQYIDRMLESGILNKLALEFNLGRKSTLFSGLKEEYEMQENEDIISIINSHN